MPLKDEGMFTKTGEKRKIAIPIVKLPLEFSQESRGSRCGRCTHGGSQELRVVAELLHSLMAAGSTLSSVLQPAERGWDRHRLRIILKAEGSVVTWHVKSSLK